MSEATDEGCGDGCPDDLDACVCHGGEVLDLLAKRHAIPILCALGVHDALRFGAIEDHLPDASTSTLSTRLDELVDAELLSREQYDEIPPRVEYRLTSDGEELCGLLEPLARWARQR